MALGVALVFTAGCATQNPTTCKVLWATIPAALGGVGGGLIGDRVVNHGEDESDGSRNWEVAAATGIGVVSGGLLGFLLGHFICREEAPPPPPPPPPPPAAPPKGTKIAELGTTHFAFDSARLTDSGRAKVREAAATMKQYPNLRVSVEGHTDSVGSDAYNQGLSERRAQSVADALAADGISPSRMSVKGFGKSKPIASNSTAEGRAQNRRVEIIAD
jgi:OOP family OmpA-OmpF porin